VHQSQQIENDEDLKTLMAGGVISALVLSWSKLLSLRNARLTVHFIDGEAGHAILRNFNHLVSSSLRPHLVISLPDWLPASIDMMGWNAKQHWQVFLWLSISSVQLPALFGSSSYNCFTTLSHGD
jgi:hypothetical protein